MRVDHVVYAAEQDGARATAERLAGTLGVEPVDGGVHPRFGTRNVILPLADERYVEVVEVLDHPASDKAPFGQVVRARSEAGGGWLGWVIEVDDMAAQEARLGREAVQGNRHRPDGVELSDTLPMAQKRNVSSPAPAGEPPSSNRAARKPVAPRRRCSTT